MILDIENDDTAIAEEKVQTEALGMKFISVPLSGFWAPEESDISKILKNLTDAENYPIFIHCQHGWDRTGLAIGLYRIFYEGWAPEKAYKEMLDMNFHPLLFPMDNFFKKTTGLEPQMPDYDPLEQYSPTKTNN